MQPWVYQYCFLLIAALASRKSLDTCRFVIVATYFWSAIQKINITFLTRTWVDLVAGLSAILPPPLLGFFGRIGWVVPAIELLVAIGLFTVWWRRAAVAAAVTMHVIILLVLMISGENSVVWPWNMAMPLLTLALFGRASDAPPSRIIIGDGSLRHALIATATGLLPILSLWGYWDSYLSSAMYSGNTVTAVVVVSPEVVQTLPPVILANTWQASRPMFIDLNRWSFDELNVPAYPAERVMRRVALAVRNRFVAAGNARVVVLERPDWRSGVRPSHSVN
jgi:hypothetical protein